MVIKMKITEEMIEYVALLSRLKISSGEKEKLRSDLGEIISYMDILSNADTEGIEPMSHTFPVKNVFREDKVVPSYDRAELLKNAPSHDEESFLVPKTVE